MLTRANLRYIRDTRLSSLDRAMEWCSTSEGGTSHEDAAHVVAFLCGTPERDPVTATVAREINKYLDRVTTVIEVKDGALRKENRTIVTLRAEVQELRKQLSEQPHPSMEAFEKQNDTLQELRAEIVGLRHDLEVSEATCQSLRDALNREPAKLTFIEADRDALEACSLRLRSELAQSDRERGELRHEVRRQERAISDLRTELNKAKDANTVLQVQNLNLRELQEQKTMSEANKPVTGAELFRHATQEKTANVVTPIPGMQYAVREYDKKDVNAAPATVSIEVLGDLQREIRQLTTERDAMRAERDALLAKNRERADRSGEAYAKPIDFTGLRDAVARLRTHTHGGWSPDFREDTTTPASDPDQDPEDPEVLVISEVLPCISDLDIQARRRVLRYLTDRLVNDWVVGDAL